MANNLQYDIIPSLQTASEAFFIALMIDPLYFEYIM